MPPESYAGTAAAVVTAATSTAIPRRASSSLVPGLEGGIAVGVVKERGDRSIPYFFYV